ncbi:MAG: peptidase U34 [Deltaproteobacteria bacterium]|nr:peptidase U34 [Deltaproteobacteria bacterium]
MCDTFAIGPSYTGKDTCMFGKNSDREPDEVQLIVSIPGMEYDEGEDLKCTYIIIPQVRHTNAMLLCRPFWMWGAEMGVNEKGVVIGNEAIFTKVKAEKKPGLIGMDLLRLALERSDTAKDAVSVIIDLLKLYGQGGPCGYRDKRLSYMNSYLIMDRQEILVLETIGRDYAVKTYNDYAVISNIITLGRDWDDGSFTPGTDIKTFNDRLITYFAGGSPRRSSILKRIEEGRGHIEIKDAFEILRNHEKPLPSKGSNRDVCMHAAEPLIRRSQTVGSLAVELDKEDGFKVFVTAGSAPCLSTFKPVIPMHPRGIPAGIDKGDGNYNLDSYWWRHEHFHVNMLFHYDRLNSAFKKDIMALEDEICTRTPFYKWDSKDPALYEISRNSFDQTEKIEGRFLEGMKGMPRKAPMLYSLYWKRIVGRNRISLLTC